VPYGENEFARCAGLVMHALKISAGRNGSTLDVRSSGPLRSHRNSRTWNFLVKERTRFGSRSEPDSVSAEPDSRVSSGS
jgi:hypothetical protein